MKHVLITALCGLIALPAAARQPLSEVREIDDGLFYVALANEIRKSCDDIEPRIFMALSTLRSLNSKARAMGYTQAEIDAYTDSDAEKARMRARGAEYYAARGVDPAVPQDLCALGRAEIQRNSQIGVLLKAK
jgi:hypothetical protein